MKYTAEEVRARFEAWAEENGYDVLRIEPDYNDGFTAAAWHGYQAAYAERIKASEGAAPRVTERLVKVAENARVFVLNDAPKRPRMGEQELRHIAMRSALLAVWPNSPAQAGEAKALGACPKHGVDYVGECSGCAMTLPEKDFTHPPAQATQSCEKCKGRGEVFNDVHVRMMTCPHCHGVGKVAPAKDAEQVHIWNKWPQGWER